MGCISSKTDINDLHPNIFQVMNVDELGNRISPGQLEITETDLVLYQRKKPPVKWPLRCLRRYGFDAELFSFESGRRCPTGPGIYAFRCQRAEQLFNLLQTHIQVRNNAGEDTVSREFPVPSVPGPAVPARVNTGVDANYLEPSTIRPGSRTNTRFSSQNGCGPTRVGSIGSSSNGPLSPQGTTTPSPPPIPPPPPPASTANNSSVYYANEELFVLASAGLELTDNVKHIYRHSYTSTDVVPGCIAPPIPTEASCPISEPVGETGSPPLHNLPTASYINVDLSVVSTPMSPTFSMDGISNYPQMDAIDTQQSHLYMNVVPGPENGVVSAAELRAKPPVVSVPVKSPPDWEVEESRHCYANLEPGEIEVARTHLPQWLPITDRLPLVVSPAQSQMPVGFHRQVNYIVLDLDQSRSDSSVGALQNPTSPENAGQTFTLPVPPESPRRAAEGYATIDFNKTVALSHSVNPNVDNDSEGSRKTRHNSTINDLVGPPTRNSSSD